VFKALVIVGTFALGACAHTMTTAPREPGAVVQVTGVGPARFGASRAELAQFIDADQPGCNAQLRGIPEGSLVFADGRLVLLWFDAPLHTAAGISTGDTVAALRSAYPHATKLSAPAGSHRFDGLLAIDGEHGYLFLHDGKTVQKAIAGYAEYLRRLFDTGFGVC
jgi:hypothetical protein